MSAYYASWRNSSESVGGTECGIKLVRWVYTLTRLLATMHVVFGKRCCVWKFLVRSIAPASSLSRYSKWSYAIRLHHVMSTLAIRPRQRLSIRLARAVNLSLRSIDDDTSVRIQVLEKQLACFVWPKEYPIHEHLQRLRPATASSGHSALVHTKAQGKARSSWESCVSACTKSTAFFFYSCLRGQYHWVQVQQNLKKGSVNFCLNSQVTNSTRSQGFFKIRRFNCFISAFQALESVTKRRI